MMTFSLWTNRPGEGVRHIANHPITDQEWDEIKDDEQAQTNLGNEIAREYGYNPVADCVEFEIWSE